MGQLSSSNALSYYNRAKKLADQGKYSEAIRYYDRAIKVAPGFSSAYQQKRLAQRALKRYGQKTSTSNSKSMAAIIPTLSIFVAMVAMSFMFYQI